MNTAAWRPTPAHARAVLSAGLLCCIAVLGRRPDLVVLATPLAVAALWARARQPVEPPTVRHSIGHSTVHEGQVTTWHVAVSDPEGGAEDVASVFSPSRWVRAHGRSDAALTSLPDDGDRPLAVPIRPTKWGTHVIHPTFVVASSALNGFRSIHDASPDSRQLMALPQSAHFDAVAPAVRSRGLVGANRSPRAGSGTEFEGIRPFAPGDRLRRIHWVESLRAGTLHVTSTFADNDRHVVLLIDAFEDVGESGGIDGKASSLDISVRAAAAIAEHYVSVGDRVTVVTMGAAGVRRLAPSSGTGHLRRLLDVLARVEPSHALFDDGRVPQGLRRGALVVLLSPLMSPSALTRLAAIAERGLSVVAIDCLPSDIAEEDSSNPYQSLAWRVEILKRDEHLRQVRRAGIAVAPWRGPGSLDFVLRGLQHRRPSRAGAR